MNRLLLLISLLLIHITFAESQISTKDFITPPPSARPSTYWEWMNGNISKEGITQDLEYMKAANYGAAMIFNVGVGIPRGNVDYNSQQWQDAIVHAVKESQRLGLRLSLHNAPGYSGTGGPWITPEKSMKQLVWSEIFVSGKNGTEQTFVLPTPAHKMGFYRDAYIVAYPAHSYDVTFRDILHSTSHISSSGNKTIDNTILSDYDLSTEYRLEKGEKLVFTLKEGMTIQSATLLRGKREKPLDPHDGPRDYAPSISIETSEDGITYQRIGQFNCPALRAMDTPGTFSCTPTYARYIRLTSNRGTNIAEIDFHTSPRLENYAPKINYIKGNISLKENRQSIAPTDIIQSSKIIDISDKVDDSGRLIWKVPAGKWSVLRIGYTTTGEVVAAAPDAGLGLECDKFDRTALDLHFNNGLAPLLDRLRPWCGNTLEALVIDSWEAGMQNWSRDFPRYFIDKRGYDILPYLPAITGRIVDDINTTERFLWDFRRTQADMFLENYVKYYKSQMAEYDLQYAGEAYGDGNFESLEFASHQDVPMSEFWTHYIYGNISTTYLAASTAHVWGRPIIACECYTGTPFTSKFTEHPYGMKALGDYIMTAGVNRFVYHATTHQPYVGTRPGTMMTMGPFGTHLDRSSTWARHFGTFNLYASRCAYMLQQGRFVADVLYLKDEAISTGVNNYNTTSPTTPYGYKWDVTDATGLHQGVKVVDGNITFPHGMKYKILVVTERERTVPETLQQIISLAQQGGTILLMGKKPVGYTGLDRDTESEVKQLSEELWGLVDNKHVFHDTEIDVVLKKKNIEPDFAYTAENKDARIHFIHRTCNDSELYFVTNHLRRPENITITCRVDNKVPYLWNAMTGETDIPIEYEIKEGKTSLNINLEESGSVFIVFKPEKTISKKIKYIYPKATQISTKNGVIDFSDETSFNSTFSLSLWAKPETFAASGRGILLFPAAGKGNKAQIGFSLGQNGIRIYERTAHARHEVLTYINPIEGWTHIAIVYKRGIPHLYLNGTYVMSGKQSKYDCIPAIDTPQSDEQYIATYEGDNTDIKVYNYPLSNQEIATLHRQGIPAPTYEGKMIKDISSEWQVKFPSWSKAPKQIDLPFLQSLHKHDNFDVKHFSGTATYQKTFTLSRREIKAMKGKHAILDLGRVENIAEVIINNSDTIVLWKAPYKTDVTSYLRSGENSITILVTNLYPNRIIGDEHLSEKYAYDEYGRIKQLPSWYKNNENIERDRVLFLPWKYYSATDPLLESGLLGPTILYLK